MTAILILTSVIIQDILVKAAHINKTIKHWQAIMTNIYIFVSDILEQLQQR